MHPRPSPRPFNASSALQIRGHPPTCRPSSPTSTAYPPSRRWKHMPSRPNEERKPTEGSEIQILSLSLHRIPPSPFPLPAYPDPRNPPFHTQPISHTPIHTIYSTHPQQKTAIHIRTQRWTRFKTCLQAQEAEAQTSPYSAESPSLCRFHFPQQVSPSAPWQ